MVKKDEREVRSTRGKRFKELTAEEIEADQEFWALDNDVWKDVESDQSFESDSESSGDEFDSDFNDSEDDDDEDEDEIRKQDDKEYRKSKAGDSGKTNRYVDPATIKKSAKSVATKQQAAVRAAEGKGEGGAGDTLVEGESLGGSSGGSGGVSVAKKKRRPDASMSIDNIVDDGRSVGSMGYGRTVRESTKTKTQDAEVSRQQESAKRPVVIRRPAIKYKYDQQELLVEALDTELSNVRWLDTQKILAADMSILAEKRRNMASSNIDAISFIKKVSRKGQNDTLTFTSIEDMPSLLRYGASSSSAGDNSNSSNSNNSSNSVSKASKKAKNSGKCVITGLPAKYRDPKTLLPYANAEAYKELKRIHHKRLSSGANAAAEVAQGVSRSTSLQSMSSISSNNKPALYVAVNQIHRSISGSSLSSNPSSPRSISGVEHSQCASVSSSSLSSSGAKRQKS